MVGPEVHGARPWPPGWPHTDRSRWVQAGGIRWHVQVFDPDPGSGSEPGDVLLLHGTGASAHSWRDVAPVLAQRRRVIVPDLPGHAFTQRPDLAGLSLPGMSAGLGALLQALQARVEIIVGHSAGAAIAARMSLDGWASPRRLVSLNGAWLPPAGQGRWFYAPLARLLALNPLVPPLFAWSARRRVAVERLVASTGSRLDERGLELYAHLVADASHVSAVLAMMAVWDLAPLWEALPRLRVPLELAVGAGDRTVPPSTSERAQRQGTTGRIHRFAGLGHLMHEEAPATILAWLQPLLDRPG